MKILEIEIKNMKEIDLSNKVYYYAKILKNNKHFICQMVTDGIFYPHMNLKEFTEYLKAKATIL